MLSDIYEKTHGNSRLRGFVTINSKKCEFISKKLKKADRGTYIMLQSIMRREEYTLINVYSLNDDQENFWKEVFNELGTIQKGFVIMAGDVNMAMDKRKDKS